MVTDHPTPQEYGTVARLFHWGTTLMVLVQVPVGIAMTSEGFPSIGDPLYVLHKGMGSILLAFVVARILWRLTHSPPPFMAHMPPLQRHVASATHRLLYVLLVVMPVSGYVGTVGDGYPIEMLDALGIPPLVSDVPGTAQVMLVVHKFSAYILTALITAHVVAAMHQSLIERDGVMSRIWPPLGRKGRQLGG